MEVASQGNLFFSFFFLFHGLVTDNPQLLPRFPSKNHCLVRPLTLPVHASYGYSRRHHHLNCCTLPSSVISHLIRSSAAHYHAVTLCGLYLHHPGHRWLCEVSQSGTSHHFQSSTPLCFHWKNTLNCNLLTQVAAFWRQLLPIHSLVSSRT